MEDEMNNYTAELDELIKLKKSKGHKLSEKDRIAYTTTWEKLILEEADFTETVERYYYDGFTFMGAEPLVKWFFSFNNPIDAMESFFKGKRYGKDKSLTFRILVSILAQLLLCDYPSENLICTIIKRLPAASKNKEMKTIGDAHLIMTRNFIKALNDDVIYPEINEMGLQPGFIKEFVALMDELMGKIDIMSLAPEERAVAIAVNRWVHPSSNSDDQETVKSEPKNEMLQETLLSSYGIESECIEDESVEKVVTEPLYSVDEPEGSYDKLIDLLKQAGVLAQDLRDEKSESEKRAESEISKLQQENSALKMQIETGNKKIASLESQLLDLEVRNTELSKSEREAVQTIDTLNTIIADNKNEIDQRTQMMEALSRDRSRQSDEQWKRLSSNLKVEYRDFKDAESLAMDSDLGENMREQLKNIFAILIKAGIELD